MTGRIRNKPSIAISGPRKKHRDASLIMVACEGEKTEAEYFSFSCFQNSRVKLFLIPSKDGKSSPVHVFSNLKTEASKYDLKAGDQLWIAADTDRWPFDTQMKILLNRRIKAIPVQLAISNPCFELFLYLHFAPMPASPVENARTMEKMLRSLLGSYSKTKLAEHLYSPHIIHAVEEAGKTVYGKNSLPENPGTDAGKLVSELLRKCPVSERR